MAEDQDDRGPRIVRVLFVQLCLLALTRAGYYRYPEPFKCVIRPRAPWAEALIRANDQLAA